MLTLIFYRNSWKNSDSEICYSKKSNYKIHYIQQPKIYPYCWWLDAIKLKTMKWLLPLRNEWLKMLKCKGA